MSFNVLTLESLDTLFQWAKSNPGDSSLATNFDSLEEELELQYAPLGYALEPDFNGLIIPSGEKGSDLETDKTNVSIVFQALRDLTPAQATDERLWATLALKHLSAYATARWPIPSDEKKISGHITSHWLCKAGARSRTRDNAVSRLWWMGRIVHQMDEWEPDDIVSILFNNSDYRANIVERSSSSSSPVVVSAILFITKEAFAADISFKRSSFRNFMKEVNYQAGRSNLAALSSTQLIELLKPIYYQCYAESKAPKTESKSFLNKFISR